jgi:hypothetical protein
MVHKRCALRLHIKFLQPIAFLLTFIREGDASFILNHLDTIYGYGITESHTPSSGFIFDALVPG